MTPYLGKSSWQLRTGTVAEQALIVSSTNMMEFFKMVKPTLCIELSNPCEHTDTILDFEFKINQWF